MYVNIHETRDGVPLAAVYDSGFLADVMADDVDGYESAIAAIEQHGEAFVGGGAAPLLYVRPVRS